MSSTTSATNAPGFADPKALVFGFDLGTASIGYAVRRGPVFLDVGVLLCPEETADLSTRRGLRRQRRTTRSRKQRREWFAAELIKLGFPAPTEAQRKADKSLNDPVALRCRALDGEKLEPHQFHAALAHLGRLRGYQDHVPWENVSNKATGAGDGEESMEKELTDEEKKRAADDKATKAAVASRRQAMADFREKFSAVHGRAAQAADYLAEQSRGHALWVEARRSGLPLADLWQAAGLLIPAPAADEEPNQRRTPWPREFIEQELRAILAAQNTAATVADWLLWGACGERKDKQGETWRVFERRTDPGAAAPGLLGLRWPRFDNRALMTDLLTPEDEEGRPVYVARKNKPEAKAALFEQAILNLRVIDIRSGKKVVPPERSLARLRERYEADKVNQRARAAKKAAKKLAAKAGSTTLPSLSTTPESVNIAAALLDRWAAEFSSEFALIEGQKPLTASLGTGRARFCRANLVRLRKNFMAIAAGQQNQEAIQPVLAERGTSLQDAEKEFLRKIKHPLVQHRLGLFLRLLGRLASEHGTPDFVVYETARSLSLGRSKRAKLMKEQARREKERQGAITKLVSDGRSTSKKAILRFRLFGELREDDKKTAICPFCTRPISFADLTNGEVDIAHLFPRAWAECNEMWNLTISHVACNRVDMLNQIPRVAFQENWADLEAHARRRFKGKKLELFLAGSREEAEALVRPGDSLANTGYISKMVRRACLVHFKDHGWLTADGRDPTGQPNHPGVLSLKVTNGQITSSLRRAWGLDAILHDRPERLTAEAEQSLTTGQLKERADKRWEVFQKNRGDHRHHAIDAMVIACTWPAKALSVHELAKEHLPGEKDNRGRADVEQGYFYYDQRRQHLLARHPLYEDSREMRRVVTAWRDRLEAEGRITHQVSMSSHKKGYELSLVSGIRWDRADPTATGFYKREKVEKLTIQKIRNTADPQRANYIYPVEMGQYLRLLWASYESDMGRFLELAAAQFAALASGDEVLRTKKNAEIESALLDHLCFEAFREWQQGGGDTADVKLSAQPRSAIRGLLEVAPTLTRKPTSEGQPEEPWSFSWHLKKGKGKGRPLHALLFKKLPPDFRDRLCFAAFQRWRARLASRTEGTKPGAGDHKSRMPGLLEPKMPDRVVIPVGSLRMLVTENAGQLRPTKIPGRNGQPAYVERKEWREARLVPLKGHPNEVVPVFVPMWRGETEVYSPFALLDILDLHARPRMILKKGQRVELVVACGGKPAGAYILTELNPSGQVHLIPPHVAKTDDAQAAFGLSLSGWRPSWKTMVPCLPGGMAWGGGVDSLAGGTSSPDEVRDDDED